MKISYRRNSKKIIEGLVWLARKMPGIDHYHVVKIFFGADKLHLNKYGRPVFGDEYIAMDYGPVPSHTYTLIKQNRSFLSPEEVQEVANSLEVKAIAKVKYIFAKRLPDLDDFSRTDIACLEESLRLHGCMTFGQLVDLTHQEPSWQAGRLDDKHSMDYALLVEEANPAKDEILRCIRETSRAISL
jgi:uncharacterized phage-associated protein